MNVNHCVILFFIFLELLLSGASSSGQDIDKAREELRELRHRLASLKPGVSSEQVLKVMGKPDEVRPVPESHFLDGTKYPGDMPGVGPETERWAYGATGKGMFARVGFVSMDRNGKVVVAMSTDCFAEPHWILPKQVPPTSEQAVATPAKLSCHAAPIKIHTAKGNTTEIIETTVTLKNAGTKRFELKHDAAYTLRRFLIVEVYDSTGMMLFRDDEMRYHSPNSPDPAEWPVLAIDPDGEISTSFSFFPSHGFGPLPAGDYSMRVYFPFEKGKHYPSNAVSFKVNHEDRTKGQK